MTNLIYSKEEKQAQLIEISNRCTCLSEAIEKHHNSPDDIELLMLIKQLLEECREYIMA